jgi:PPOX class probable F420-dependent enzyme
MWAEPAEFRDALLIIGVMELSEALEFARGRHGGVLTTLKRDGRPQLSNITYGVGDDDVIRVSVTAGRAKTANARRDPRVSLYVVRDDFWAYTVIEGDAEISPISESPDDATVEELITLYRSIQGEHPDWDDYRRAMVADRRLVLRLRPTYAYGYVG